MGFVALGWGAYVIWKANKCQDENNDAEAYFWYVAGSIILVLLWLVS